MKSLHDHPCRVLVVDDDSDIRDALCEVLRDEGYGVASATDGVEALASLQSPGVPPCVIVLDLMMPRMDGWHFRAEQKRDPALSDIPVVVISASGRESSIDSAEFLRKPIDIDHFIAAVERYC